MSCPSCNCNPCSCSNSCDPDNEGFSSSLANFILGLVGQVEKSCVNGSVVWTWPCDLQGDEPVEGYPRGVDESVLCYFLRVLQGVTGGGGPGSAIWGAITGDINDQADLSAILNNKQNLSAILTALAGLSNSAGSLTNDGAGGLSWTGGTGIGSYAIIEERYAAGVDGPSSSVGWNKRTLNVVSYDPANLVNNLAAGRVQLDTGTYIVKATGIAFATAAGTGMRDKLRINNFTDTAVIWEGLSNYGAFNVSSSTTANLDGVLVVTNALKEYQLDHYFEYADATGQGLAVGAVTGATYEKYASLKLLKIA